MRRSLRLLAFVPVLALHPPTAPACMPDPAPQIALEPLWRVTQVLAQDSPGAVEGFGAALSIDGDVAAIGASSYAAVFGNAYAFERDPGGAWQQAALLETDAGPQEPMGTWLGTSDGRIAVGREFVPDDGVASVFATDGSSWGPRALVLPVSGGAEHFAHGVALSGPTLVVGDYGDGPGDAFVFDLVGGAWTFVTALAPPGLLSPSDSFGWTVALDGDVCAVGALGDDDAGANAGAVWVFERDGGSWTRTAKLLGSGVQSFDNAGRAQIDVDGERIAVGVPGADPAGSNSGGVFVFEKRNGTWIETAALQAPDGSSGDGFGTAVALDGPWLVAGAPGESAGGAAHLFVRAAGTWVHGRTLARGPDLALGSAVAVDGTTAMVGAPGAAGGLGEVFVLELVFVERKLHRLPSPPPDPDPTRP